MCELLSHQSGVAKLIVPGRWLDANGGLLFCAAKPPQRIHEIRDDSSLPTTVAFARSIFGRQGQSRSRLEHWFDGRAGMLAFPEYNFSSNEFAELNDLVKGNRAPIIVLAGFGAVLGGKIIELLNNGCSASWSGGSAAIDPQGRYNAGWCWIHDGRENTQCIIFLKNFADTSVEVFEIPNLRLGQSILCIETDDLLLFPLICSDLISEQQDSPRRRITANLAGATGGRKAIVCTLSCNSAPSSGWWRTAIDDVVRQHHQSAVLVLVNQCVTQCNAEEDFDRWRCMTGAFVSQTRMKRPVGSFTDVRYVQTEVAASGLILRSPKEGVGVATINLDLNGPATARYVWQQITRQRYEASDFAPDETAAEECEVRRYLSRRKDIILSLFPEAKSHISSTFDLVAAAPKDQLIPRLWPELLEGPKDTIGQVSPDPLTLHVDYLDSALAVFAAIQYSTNGAPVNQGAKRGQLLWEGMELRVWRCPDLRADEMLEPLKKVALDGGDSVPLICLGRGNALGDHIPAMRVEAQKLTPGPLTDVSSPAPEDGDATDIQVSRHRPVFWRPLSEIEGVLLAKQTDLQRKVREAITKGLDLT